MSRITKTEIADVLRGKPPQQPYKLADGGGLYLFVTPTASCGATTTG